MDFEENEITPETKEDFEALAQKIIDSLMEGTMIYRWNNLFSTLIIEEPSENFQVKEDRDRKEFESYADTIINIKMDDPPHINLRWENGFKRLIIETVEKENFFKNRQEQRVWNLIKIDKKVGIKAISERLIISFDELMLILRKLQRHKKVKITHKGQRVRLPREDDEWSSDLKENPHE